MENMFHCGENCQIIALAFAVFFSCVLVGGIPVKEHFEINVAPIQIQMTYQLYKAVMQFFFPDKNIETDDGELGSIFSVVLEADVRRSLGSFTGTVGLNFCLHEHGFA